MHAIKLEGENIGPWQGEFSFTFQLGAVGIFGPNGAGKSTIVDLMYSALTNDWTRVAPLKLDVINNQAGKRSAAWVKFTFSLGGVVCSIRRGIKPSANELIVGKDSPVTNDKEITQKLDKLGIDSKMLGQCVFLEQNAIHEFLELPQGDRAKVYQALNHTGECEVLHGVISEMLAKDRDLCVEIVDNSAELGTRLDQLKEKEHDLELQRSVQAELLLSAEHLAAAEKMIAKAARFDTLALRKPRLEADLAKAKQAAKVARELENEKFTDAESIRLKMGELEPSYTSARDTLKQWTNFLESQKLRESREKKRCELVESLKRPAPPLEPGASTKAAEHRTNKMRLQRELEDAKARIKMFVDTKKVECPTCGTPVDHLDDMLRHSESVVEAVPAKISEEERAAADIEVRMKARSNYDTWKEVEQTKLKGVETALAEMSQLSVPAGDIDSLQKIIDTYKSLQGDEDLLYAALRKLTPDRSAKEATQAALQKQYDELWAEMKICNYDADRLRQVSKRVQEHRDAVAVAANLQGQLTQVGEEVINIDEQLDQLKARIARQAKVRGMVEILTRVRDAVHRNALPQRVAQANLNSMEGAINQGLELFGSPFWVETQDNLDFLVHKPGESGQKVAQTSIGQRVLLAIAFWGASHSLYRAELGMLVLDEPTANLDAPNRKYLAEAIARLSKRVRDKRQVLVITHADELAGSFDQVIDLGQR